MENKFENQPEVGIFWEFFIFLQENKLWWMTPIFVVISMLGTLISMGTAAGSAAPFIYALF